jgi:integrase
MSGRGHIRRRGANSWELKYDRGGNGGRHTVYRSFKGTKREAQAELARLLAQVADGAHVDPSKLTVADYMRERIAHWQASGVHSPLSAQRADQLLVGQVVPYLGTRLVQKLSTRDIETWHATLMLRGRKGRYGAPDGASGVSTATIGRAHNLLSKALDEGVRHGLVVKNVCRLQRPPRGDTEEIQILTPQQVEDLPTLLRGHALEAPALTALYTGMRRGEILALRWGNVDLDGAEIIRVRQSIEETKAGLRFKPPKSKAGIRDIRLPAIVTDVLQAHRKRELERRLQLRQGKLTDDALVFPMPDGSPQRPNSFGSLWSKWAKAQGVNVSFHALRHTHASQLIDMGVDVVTISRRLGHSSPSITLDVYAHLFRKDDGKAAAAINAAFARA